MHFCLSLPKASLFLWWWSCHTYVLRQALFLNIRKVFIPKFDVISFCKMHLVSTYMRVNMFCGIESNIINLRKNHRIYGTYRSTFTMYVKIAYPKKGKDNLTHSERCCHWYRITRNSHTGRRIHWFSYKILRSSSIHVSPIF